MQWEKSPIKVTKYLEFEVEMVPQTSEWTKAKGTMLVYRLDWANDYECVFLTDTTHNANLIIWGPTFEVWGDLDDLTDHV